MKSKKLRVLYKNGDSSLGQYDRPTHTITIFRKQKKDVCNIGDLDRGFCIGCRRCFFNEEHHFVNILNHEMYHAVNRRRIEKLWKAIFMVTLLFEFLQVVIISTFRKVPWKIVYAIEVLEAIFLSVIAKMADCDDEQRLAHEFAGKNEGRINKKAWRIAESNTEFLPDVEWIPDSKSIKAFKKEASA